MRIGVLGTGMVGQTIATKLVSLGHEVCMGSRTAANPKAAEWAGASGALGSHGTFSDCARFGDILFNCTAGEGTIDAIESAGLENFRGKILLDLSNPLDFSGGMPPVLFSGNFDSLGERIQLLLPQTKVVKTLNTVNCRVMVAPKKLGGGDHHVFLCGNHAGAKSEVSRILKEWFGWSHVLDIGDITMSRGLEVYVAFWVRLYMSLGTPDFNIKVVR